MKLRSLLPFLVVFAAPAAPAVTVLTNTAGTPTTSQLVRGPGGFLGQSIALGFEFTVTHPDDWALLTVSLNITSISGTAPLEVEIYGSPAGPDTATFISALTAPSFYTTGLNTWTAATPINLDSGETYFVRVYTAAPGTSYGLARTADPLTGGWTLDAHYTQPGSNPWALSGNDAPVLEMTAVPEPSALAVLLGGAGALLLGRRRRMGVVCAAAAGVGFSALPAVAGPRVVMDFGPVAVSNVNTVQVASPYVEDQLRLSNAQNPAFLMLPTNATYYTGRKSLFAATNGSTTTLTVDAGGTFTPVSVRCLTRNGSIGEIEFTGVKPGGTTTAVHKIGYGTNYQNGTVGSFPAEFNNIVALRILTASPYVSQFDDITVDLPEAVSVTGGGTYTEGHGNIPVGLALTAPLATNVTATWTITDATTTAGSDYTLPGGVATGTLTIPAGQTQAVIQLPLLNDTAVESLESCTVTFTGLTGGYFVSGGNVVTVKIASDDSVANFAGWMAAHGLSAGEAVPAADPNGDGVSNIESWLCRINPAGPSPAAWLERRATYFTTASNVPGLRFTVPVPLPSDVRMIFEESTGLASFSEQTRRSGFAVGSLWTGSGASRVVESNSLSARTITLPGSATLSARPRAFYRMKYELVSGGGD